MSDSTTSSCTASSGTSSTLTCTPKELMINKFVFRNPIEPLPSGSESNKRSQYLAKPEWGRNEILDRRLREKVVVTFSAENTDNNVGYQIYLVKEDDSHVKVTYDNQNSLVGFSVCDLANLSVRNDGFYKFQDPQEGPKYLEPWESKFMECQKIDLIPEGKYKCKMITRDVKKKKRTWYSENSIEIKGDPFKVTIICTPMSNPEIETESGKQNRSSHYIKEDGQRIDRDCYLKVYRGKHPSDSVEVGTFKALMMPTSLVATPNSQRMPCIATPKATYFGYKDKHSNVYDCVELESTKRTQPGDGQVMLLNNCINPDTGKNYKVNVQIHKNPNNWGWTSDGLSYGCVVVPSKVPEDQFGTFGDLIKNKQNKIKKNSLMGAVFGGYDTKVIPDKTNRDRKLNIKVELKSAVGDQYSAYRKIHEDIIQELSVTPNGQNFDISFRVPKGIFRNYKGEVAHFAVKGNTQFRWCIAKEGEFGEVVRLRWLPPGSNFSELNPGEYKWPWDGCDELGRSVFLASSAEPPDFSLLGERERYLCVIETKFNIHLTQQNTLSEEFKMTEERLLNTDGTLGSAWNCPIEIPSPLV